MSKGNRGSSKHRRSSISSSSRSSLDSNGGGGVEKDIANWDEDCFLWLDDELFDHRNVFEDADKFENASPLKQSPHIHIVEEFMPPRKGEQIASTKPLRRGRQSQYGATAERQFVCPACKRSYKRRDHLLRHERVDHSDVGKIPCPNCGSLKRPDNLNVHIKKMHRDQIQPE
jgi:hypothetical protein